MKQFATLGLDGHAVGREDAATVWSGERSRRGALDARVKHETVAAGERSDEARGVRMFLQRQRGQLQTGDPPFRAGFQRGDVFCSEVEAHCPIEEPSGCGRSKTQVGDAQFA